MSMINLHKPIELVEVSPRDGLQNEKSLVPIATKVDLINRLSAAGFRHIEVGSFVSPKWVPQMADTEAVFAAIDKQPGVTYSCLVPNEQGMRRALACGVKTVAVFISASEGFSKANLNCTIAESLQRLEPVLALAKQHGIAVRGYVSCVVGCPFDGAVAPSQVAVVADELAAMGCYEISLGDTIGVGYPEQVKSMLAAVTQKIAVDKLAIHCHDTYGRAVDNILAAMDLGVRVIDASVAGIGGCPYAKSATGNVATEKVLAMLAAKGLAHGVDVAKATAAGQFIASALGRL
jgi:hydroxymethylglutaryl-CoA lyase